MLDCSKTLEFAKADELMCSAGCTMCPVSSKNSGTGLPCSILKRTKIEKYIELLQKWVNEHCKTYADDFFEKFPNAPKKTNGNPAIEWCKIYGRYGLECVVEKTCNGCWEQIMEVSK